MARVRSTPRRYAEAAFGIGERDGTIEDWNHALASAAQALSDPRIVRVLANPALPFAGRRSLVERLLGEAVSGLPRSLVLLLVQRGRIDLLPGVAHEFRRLRNRRAGIVEATATSAAPLTDRELAALRERLALIAGGQVELELQVDPALIGGVSVRIGDQLFDGSVRGRLERLRTRLATGAL
jgi:F-type H+-transporting ATPase subunit delta